MKQFKDLKRIFVHFFFLFFKGPVCIDSAGSDTKKKFIANSVLVFSYLLMFQLISHLPRSSGDVGVKSQSELYVVNRMAAGFHWDLIF